MRWALLLAVPLLCAAEAVDVTVTVTNVRSDRGQVLVTLCDRANFLKETCAYKGRTAARPGSVSIRITGVPPGLYAAQAFQDENGNNRIDTNFIGMPTEGIGFSRDAPMRFGPPKFEDAAVVVGAGTAVAFALKYFD